MATHDLVEEVSEKRREYRTDYYSMSIGEIVNMYRDDELIINPDFQRFFRWTDYQKSRLIESILLGIPVPEIFVYQQEDGRWEVVDGQQRVSTLLEFFGLLRDEEGKIKPPLTLASPDILEGLANLTVESFPEPMLLQLKRGKFKVEIIQKESDPDAKFEVFMRLNTGGSQLTDQELRNSWLVMYNKDLYLWLEQIAKDPHFLECISLSDKLLEERYNMELALSFFVFPAAYDEFAYNDKSDQLTRSLKTWARQALEGSFNYDQAEEQFRSTFHVLDNALGDWVFRKYHKQGDFHRGKFLESLFETVAIGVGANSDKYDPHDDHTELVRKIRAIWDQDDFLSNMGVGTNTKRRIPHLVPFGMNYFAK